MQREDPAVLLGKEVRLWLAGDRNDRIEMRSVKRAMLKEGAGELWAYPSRIRFHGYAERLVIYNRPAAEFLREAGEAQGKQFLSAHVHIVRPLLDQARL